MQEGIRVKTVKKDNEGNYTHIRFHFGPHYFVELKCTESNRVTFKLGATHHGFEADASEVNGELEQIVEQIRENHPECVIN